MGFFDEILSIFVSSSGSIRVNRGMPSDQLFDAELSGISRDQRGRILAKDVNLRGQRTSKSGLQSITALMLRFIGIHQSPQVFCCCSGRFYFME